MFRLTPQLVRSEASLHKIWHVVTKSREQDLDNLELEDEVDSLDVNEICKRFQNLSTKLSLDINGNLMEGLAKVFGRKVKLLSADIARVQDQRKKAVDKVRKSKPKCKKSVSIGLRGSTSNKGRNIKLNASENEFAGRRKEDSASHDKPASQDASDMHGDKMRDETDHDIAGDSAGDVISDNAPAFENVSAVRRQEDSSSKDKPASQDASDIIKDKMRDKTDIDIAGDSARDNIRDDAPAFENVFAVRRQEHSSSQADKSQDQNQGQQDQGEKKPEELPPWRKRCKISRFSSYIGMCARTNVKRKRRRPKDEMKNCKKLDCENRDLMHQLEKEFDGRKLEHDPSASRDKPASQDASDMIKDNLRDKTDIDIAGDSARDNIRDDAPAFENVSAVRRQEDSSSQDKTESEDASDMDWDEESDENDSVFAGDIEEDDITDEEVSMETEIIVIDNYSTVDSMDDKSMTAILEKIGVGSTNFDALVHGKSRKFAARLYQKIAVLAETGELRVSGDSGTIEITRCHQGPAC